MPQYGCNRGHSWVTADDHPSNSGCPQCEYENQIETDRMRKQARIFADEIERRIIKPESVSFVERWEHARTGGVYERVSRLFRLESSLEEYGDNALLRVDLIDGVLSRTTHVGPRVATLQTEVPMYGSTWCFLYRRVDDDAWWARPIFEFLDGRFRRIQS